MKKRRCADKEYALKTRCKRTFFWGESGTFEKYTQKGIKNHQLSLELYNTGNSDAIYLAGLMADENKITESQLDDWVDKAYWYYLSEFAETDFGFQLGLKWIQSDKERIASAGWVTLAYYAGVNKDEDLNINTYSQLLDKVENEIHNSQNRVRFTMNGFVIAIGTYIKDLTEKSNTVASKIGKIMIDMNGTACKVPLASEYINKAIEKGQIGKKRKKARC